VALVAIAGIVKAMIVVRVELWPGGDRSKAESLGEAVIINDGSGTATQGNYHFALSRRGQTAKDQAWRDGQVRGFPRKRLGGWDLVYRALHAAVGERNVPR
jgi:hypothetical protein